MSHLTLEAIARLVDEPPDQQELAHLDGCAACRGEVDDMRADAAALAALPPIDPPAGQWHAVEARLATEGLVRLPARRASWRSTIVRMAAAVVIFLLGSMAGVAWVSAETEDVVAAGEADAPLGISPVGEGRAVPYAERDAPRIAQGESTPAAPSTLRAGPGANIQLVSSLITAREPRNPEEAARLVREVEALYFQTLTHIAEAGPAAAAADPFTRLAVLEGITTLTGTALGQAPADPILNGYHLAALAQREATLKLIAARSAGSWF